MSRTEADLPTVFLHIGTPKSGTTYLQSRLDTDRGRAAEQGLLWPGPRWGVMVEAVRDLRLLEPGGRLDPEGPWMRLVDSALAWTGSRVLISMEWMAGCTSAQVEAAVRSLQPARVEVICTSRDLLRMFVAQWQEMTKNCRPWSWQQFVNEVVGELPGPASERFWAQQDVPVILQRWAEYIPWDRFHLVTVPPPGSDPNVLWDRFCSVLAIDGTEFEQPERVNESLGVVSASLMHRVNLVAIAEGLDRVAYQRVLHHRLADEVLAPWRDREAPIAVSPEVDAWIRARAQRQVNDLRKLDVHVVGDLDELLPGHRLEGREPSDVSDSELLDTCVEALVTFAMTQDVVTRQLREENRMLRQRSGRKGSGKNRPAGDAKRTDDDPRSDGLSRKAQRLARRSTSRLAKAVRRHEDDPTP
jgi:hypothetical protein